MKEKDTEIMAKHNDHSINDRTNYTTVRLDKIALKEITKSSFKYDPWEKLNSNLLQHKTPVSRN